MIPATRCVTASADAHAAPTASLPPPTIAAKYPAIAGTFTAMVSAPCGLAPVGRSLYARARRDRASRLRAAIPPGSGIAVLRASVTFPAAHPRDKTKEILCVRSLRSHVAAPLRGRCCGAVAPRPSRHRRIRSSFVPSRPRRAQGRSLRSLIHPLGLCPLKGAARWSDRNRLGAPHTVAALRGPGCRRVLS